MTYWLEALPAPVFWLLTGLYLAAVAVAGGYVGLRVYRRLLSVWFGWRLRRFMRDDVPAPQGVRIIRPNGTRIPIDLGYVGLQDGTHVWAPVHSGIMLGAQDRVEVDILPGLTAITFPSDPGGPA